jgi:putative flippase GtrA
MAKADRMNFKNIMTFVVLSGIGWLIDFAVFGTLVSVVNLAPFFANYISSVCGAAFAFFAFSVISTKGLYRPRGRELGIYIAYQVISITLFSLAIEFLSRLFGEYNFVVLGLVVAPLLAKVVVTPFSLLTNYVVSRLLIGLFSVARTAEPAK